MQTWTMIPQQRSSSELGSSTIHYKVTLKSAVKTVNLAKVSGLLLFVVSQKIGCLLIHPQYGRLHGCALDLLPDLRNHAPNLLLNQPATNLFSRFCTRQRHRVLIPLTQIYKNKNSNNLQRHDL